MTAPSLVEFLHACLLDDQISIDAIEKGYVEARNHAPNTKRARRELEAKRAILEGHQIKPAYEVEDKDEDFGCGRCYSDEIGVLGFGNCPTLKALAAVYSDHPSYREEWAPLSTP